MSEFLWPNGSKDQPRITGNFGPRQSFWTPGGWTSNFHYGTDMVGFSEVCSPVDGEVIFAGDGGGWGNLSRVREHDTGDVFYLAHLARFIVGRGAQVRAGDPVGIMGTTGKSTGVHLHYEVHPDGGAAVDAVPYTRQRLAALAAAEVDRPQPLPQQEEENMFIAIVPKKGGGTKAFFCVPNPRAAADAKQKPYIGMVIDGPAPAGVPVFNGSGQWSWPYVERYVENANQN